MTRSGKQANAPLNEHKRAYYASKGINGSLPIGQMERAWLQKLTGVTSNAWAVMWIQAVAGQGLTPSPSININKFIFYSQVTSSP